jgi:hypothetical protein
MFGLFSKKPNRPLFRFSEPENTACFSCDHVVSGQKPILYVSHDAEGDWQFLCGGDDHTEANAKVISLKEVTMIDPSVNDLYEMPQGVAAGREQVGAKWVPFRTA